MFVPNVFCLFFLFFLIPSKYLFGKSIFLFAYHSNALRMNNVIGDENAAPTNRPNKKMLKLRILLYQLPPPPPPPPPPLNPVDVGAPLNISSNTLESLHSSPMNVVIIPPKSHKAKITGHQ